jgi:hypothetical protein
VKLTLKVIVPKWSFGGRSMVSMDQQTTTAPVFGEWASSPPGSKTASSLTLRLSGNQGDPIIGAQGVSTSRQASTARKEAVMTGSRRRPYERRSLVMRMEQKGVGLRERSRET